MLVRSPLQRWASGRALLEPQRVLCADRATAARSDGCGKCSAPTVSGCTRPRGGSPAWDLRKVVPSASPEADSQRVPTNRGSHGKAHRRRIVARAMRLRLHVLSCRALRAHQESGFLPGVSRSTRLAGAPRRARQGRVGALRRALCAGRSGRCCACAGLPSTIQHGAGGRVRLRVRELGAGHYRGLAARPEGPRPRARILAKRANQG